MTWVIEPRWSKQAIHWYFTLWSHQPFMLLWKLHFSNALSNFRKIIFLPIITQRKVWIGEILVLFVCFSFWLHLPHPSPKQSSCILLWFPVHYLEKNTRSFPLVYWLLVSSYIFLIPCHWFHWTSLSRPGSCVRHCEIEGMDLGLLGPLVFSCRSAVEPQLWSAHLFAL